MIFAHQTCIILMFYVVVFVGVQLIIAIIMVTFENCTGSHPHTEDTGVLYSTQTTYTIE